MLLILLQAFSKVWVIVLFKANQDYIARELCVNRYKPEVLCSGKCVLTKNLKADEEQKGKPVPKQSKEQTETAYCLEDPVWLLAETDELIILKKRPDFYRTLHTSRCVARVFHPPNTADGAMRIA